MTQSAPQIVHESEAQRQFVRIRMPAKVAMGGEVYAVRDLSSGGLAILDVEGSYEKGKALSIELMLPFHDFTLDIQLEAQVQNFDAGSKAIGARFINLSKQQISLLNHVIKSYIAGDVVAGEDVLSVVARDNFVRVRKQDGGAADPVAPKFGRQLLPLFFIAILGFSGLFIIANSVYQSAFTIKTPDGVVEGTLTNLTAQDSGTYKSALQAGTVSVKSGDLIGSLTNAAGVETSIASPCDCFIYSSKAQDGDKISAGETLVTLTPTDGDTLVKVRMDTVTVQRLKMSATPMISIAGDDFERTGRILEIKSSLSEKSANATLDALQQPFVYVTIQSDQKIPADLIGRPAQVTFKMF